MCRKPNLCPSNCYSSRPPTPHMMKSEYRYLRFLSVHHRVRVCMCLIADSLFRPDGPQGDGDDDCATIAPPTDAPQPVFVCVIEC